jgi:hypothetical protein
VIGGRLHRGATLALGVAALATTLLHWYALPSGQRSPCAPPLFTEITLAELLWYAFGASLLLFVPAITRPRAGRTRAQTWMLALGVGGMLAAQIADSPELTFPLIRWDMFARPAQRLSRVSGYRLRAVMPDGSRRMLSLVDLYGFPGWRVDAELAGIAKHLDSDRTCHRDNDLAPDQRRLEQLVTRIAKLVPDAVALEVVLLTWPDEAAGLEHEQQSVRWTVAPGDVKEAAR